MISKLNLIFATIFLSVVTIVTIGFIANAFQIHNWHVKFDSVFWFYLISLGLGLSNLIFGHLASSQPPKKMVRILAILASLGGILVVVFVVLFFWGLSIVARSIH